MKGFCKRLVGRIERRIRVVAHAVPRWQQSGEQAAVRRQRQRGDRCRILEDDTFGSKPVEGGRSGRRRAIGPQMIGANGVDRDDDERSSGA